MGAALQVVSGRVTNPGATITALTVDTGDAFTVRAFPDAAGAFLLNVWTQQGTLGVTRIRSARLHDQVQGIRLRNSAASRPLLPYESLQRLYPSDLLTYEVSGSAAATDASSMLLYYSDLPGVNARFITPAELYQRMRNVFGAEQAFSTSATAGDYGGSQAINADFDQFKRGTDYALLGTLTDTGVCTIGVAGADTGNLRVGVPGVLDPDVTSDWFVQLSNALGIPLIPVINADNVGSTNVDAVHTTASAAINVTLIMAELAGTAGA